MTHEPMVVVRPADPGPAGSPERLLQDATDVLRPRAAVDRLEEAIDQLRTHQDQVASVVIGPGVADPLLVGRELRRTAGAVALLYVVAPEDAERMRLEVGMLAELRPVEVIATGGSSQQLADELRVASFAAARRRESDRTIDALNRELVGRPRQDLEQAAGGTVSESHLAAIVRHVPEAIVSVDHDHRVVAFNDAAVELFDVSHGDSLDDELQGALAGDAPLRRLLESALEGTTTTGEDVELDTDDGGLLLAATAAPVRDHMGTVIGAVLVVRDITVQRRSEDRLRQLQKAESLATLAGGVAHDFNNLLVTVRSWAQLAAEDPSNAELAATALEKIDSAAERAAELARAMLVYSGRGRFELELVDISQLAGQMAELLRGSVHRKIEVRLELDEALPPVEAASSQLRQVLMNLITNAAEAIGESPGTIAVRTRRLERVPPAKRAGLPPADAYVVVEVADTGPGMDQATLDRAFEPFFSTKFDGRGLGLAASQGIVRAHAGTLTVVSHPGQGTTFRMTLPVPRQASSS